MASLPHLSVVLPIYNGGKYLQEALQSVLNQTYVDFELIAINDGSTDNSLDILQSCNDARLRIFTQQNQGLIATLRRGIELARSPLVARMDQDDVCLPQRFASQVAFLQAHPDVGVCGGAVLLSENGKQRVVTFPTSDAEIRWRLCFNSPLVHPTVMFRKEVVEQVSSYRQAPGAELSEDYDLWTRLAPVTKFANLAEPLLMLRKHSENMTVTSAGKHVQQSQGVSQRYVQALLNRTVSIDAIRALRLDEVSTSDIFAAATLLKEMYAHFRTKISRTQSERTAIKKDFRQRLTTLASSAFHPSTKTTTWQRVRAGFATGLVYYYLRYRLILGIQFFQKLVKVPARTSHA